MPRPKRSEPPILAMLEKAFAKYRKKVKPLFPYDAQTDVIHLPHDIEVELRYLVVTGKGVEAVKRVTELTGAGLRVSKDYVDSLARQR
jgi:ribosomal protein L7/L12